MMTIQEIFNLGLKMAIANDPRGEKGVKNYLASKKEVYKKMSSEEQKFFDTEYLTNPYSDSRIHLGDKNTKVKRVLTGIDISDSEILLASQLEERNKKIDLIIAHHPVGKSLADLHSVIDMTTEVYIKYGIPVHKAEKIMEDKIKEIGRGVHPSNHYRIIDMARLLNINLMNTHTITDNLVSNFVEKHLQKDNPKTIDELMKSLNKIPEYQEGRLRGFGPKIFSGSGKRRVGKFIMEMTGGTAPSNEVYQELSRAGVSTIVSMHMKEDSIKKANAQNMNVVIAGHISSDSLGMNLFLDELEKNNIEVITCGGLIRVKRNQTKKSK